MRGSRECVYVCDCECGSVPSSVKCEHVCVCLSVCLRYIYIYLKYLSVCVVRARACMCVIVSAGLCLHP